MTAMLTDPFQLAGVQTSPGTSQPRLQMPAMEQDGGPIPAGNYYETYHGHKISHLDRVHTRLRESGVTSFIYLAGDSSLDNKHWFFDMFANKASQLSGPSDIVADAVNGYEQALAPPFMVKDVCYWLNVECSQRSEARGLPHTAAINTAVEESCLSARESDGLLPQDEFIRHHITGDDVLVVDVGGNDVALRPTAGVILNMAMLLYLTPTWCIRANLAPGLLYFVHMFRCRLRRYIEQLVEVRKPKKVVVCMLYFLDVQSGGSWADGVLEKLGYDSNPAKLQAVMRKVYYWGVSQMRIPGVDVVPLPLYEVLDGTCTEDYVQRVEPSVTGGQKMARAIASKIFD